MKFEYIINEKIFLCSMSSEMISQRRFEWIRVDSFSSTSFTRNFIFTLRLVDSEVNVSNCDTIVSNDVGVR